MRIGINRSLWRRLPLAPAALLLIAGCATTRSNRQIVLKKEPAEYGEQCAEARRRAREPDRPIDYRPPSAIQVPFPPLPVPNRLRGKSVHATMDVDSVGRIQPSTLVIRGLNDEVYEAQIRRALLAHLKFSPARIGRCGVTGKAELRYDL